MQIKELEDLINDLPYNEKDPFPIKIITEDFIIIKESRETFSIKNNRLFIHHVFKRKYKLNSFKKVFNSSDKIKKSDYFSSYFYVLVMFVVWFYFVIANINSISVLLTQNFANASITTFLLWLSLISIIAFYYFIYINIAKPFFRKYKILLDYFNPYEAIIEKNEIIIFFLFTFQIIYFYILYPLYIPYTNLIIIEYRLQIFYGFFTAGIFISIHYAAINITRLLLNLKNKRNVLTYLYASLQRLKIQDENYILITKLVEDLENFKIISFGLITKIVSSITLLFAIIPNIVYTA